MQSGVVCDYAAMPCKSTVNRIRIKASKWQMMQCKVRRCDVHWYCRGGISVIIRPLWKGCYTFTGCSIMWVWQDARPRACTQSNVTIMKQFDDSPTAPVNICKHKYSKPSMHVLCDPCKYCYTGKLVAVWVPPDMQRCPWIVNVYLSTCRGQRVTLKEHTLSELLLGRGELKFGWAAFPCATSVPRDGGMHARSYDGDVWMMCWMYRMLSRMDT